MKSFHASSIIPALIYKVWGSTFVGIYPVYTVDNQISYLWTAHWTNFSNELILKSHTEEINLNVWGRFLQLCHLQCTCMFGWDRKLSFYIFLNCIIPHEPSYDVICFNQCIYMVDIIDLLKWISIKSFPGVWTANNRRS